MDEDKEKKTHLISRTSFVIMVAVAAVCDLISAGLGLIIIDGGILNIIFCFTVDMGIWFWTATHGMGWKGAMAGGAGMVIEFLPVINILPTFTAAVVGLYIASRVQEKVPLVATVMGGKMNVKSVATRVGKSGLQKRRLNRSNNEELNYQE